MSIFISWSGSSNRDVGRKLKQFVSEVLGTDAVFMSDEDIAPGDKSLEEIDLALRRSTAALVIVSAKTAKEPWLNFEAGAMAVRLEKTSVIPILLDLTFSQLIQPLAQFQAIRYDDEQKFRRTLFVLNSQRGDERIKIDTLNIVFDSRWPLFQAEVAAIIESTSSPEDVESLPGEHEKIDEILSTLRGLANNSTSLAPAGRSASASSAGPSKKNDNKTGPYMRMRVGRIVPLMDSNFEETGSVRYFSADAAIEALSDVAVRELTDLAVKTGFDIDISAHNVYYQFSGSGKGVHVTDLS